LRATEPAPGQPGGPALLLYDGECGLCDGVVRFTLARDRAGRVRFAALQSERAQALLAEHGVARTLDSMVLLRDGRAHLRSRAALHLLRTLGFPWSLAWALVAVPRPLADAAYAWVARNRYRWFGRRDACALPAPEVRARFLA
jgi:predicted DCC family thiol-disulfide oxidoreductase YuxK